MSCTPSTQRCAAGNIPGVLALLDPDVIVDEPLALPYRGVHQGRYVIIQSILGTMTRYSAVEFHEVVDGVERKIDVYTKYPEDYAAPRLRRSNLVHSVLAFPRRSYAAKPRP